MFIINVLLNMFFLIVLFVYKIIPFVVFGWIISCLFVFN
ncbi:hypothetical protein SAMN06265367_108160 [Algoriphagus winogradskyi]|uniref:Uncharacterized protein n=1 Tax=Algoriphagus winogradskyi TaxID=237017 RepID=A0ABY1PG18_9BACT|nr:hypothetical protein SAMN06265367_108160 [Algoriphagus winogradskyi]